MERELKKKVDRLGTNELKVLLGYVKQSIHFEDSNYDVDAGYWKE